VPDHGALRRGDPTWLGPYQLIGRLGEGGQGVVYAGVAPGGGRVAVKVLQANLADDAGARRRFLREAAVARRVAGFCTAKVLDVGVADERPYIVSEYIDGSSLYRRVTAGGPLDEGALHRLAVGTAAALTTIHRAGVVHRDLKPSNVLLGPDGPRVVDFGIARALDASITQNSTVLGTPAYMSPEQVAGAVVGPASDVFSWATTLVFAATGEPPFGRDSIPAVLHRVLDHEPDLSAVPGALRPLIAWCLAKRPDRRPDAAQLLLTLLGHDVVPGYTPDDEVLREGVAAASPSAIPLSDTQPYPNPPPTLAEAAPPDGPPRRRLWPVWAMVGLLVLGIALAAPSLLRDDPGGRHPEAFGAPVGDPMKGQADIVSLSVGSLNGSSIAVTGGTYGDETLRVWNLSTGRQLGEPMGMGRGFLEDEGSLSVAVGTLSGQAVAVSGSDTSQLFSIDKTVRVWDLATHRQINRLSGHTAAVTAVAVGKLGSRTVAVSGSHDKTLRVWDLAAGRPVGEPMTGHTGAVNAVAIGTVEGRAVAVSASDDETLRVWDLATGKPRGAPMTGHTDRVTSVALGALRGKPIAVSGGSASDRAVRVWDLTTGRPIGKPLTGHGGWIGGVAVTQRLDRPIAVSGSYDGTLRAWDLTTGQQLGTPFAGHKGGVNAVAIVEGGNHPVAVSGGADGTVRRWSLRPPAPSGV
jgi:hypothetical protein